MNIVGYHKHAFLIWVMTCMFQFDCVTSKKVFVQFVLRCYTCCSVQKAKKPFSLQKHTLYLAGIYRGGHDALVRAKLALDTSGVTMQLTVRSTDPSVSEVLATAIA